MRRARIRVRYSPAQLPKDMRRALRALEMSTADDHGRLTIQEVVIVGRREPHEPAERRAEDDATGFIS